MHYQINIYAAAAFVASHESAIGDLITGIVVLDSDSADRAIATYMDINPMVAKLIEDGQGIPSAIGLPNSRPRTNRPLDPSWFGDIYNDPTRHDA